MRLTIGDVTPRKRLRGCNKPSRSQLSTPLICLSLSLSLAYLFISGDGHYDKSLVRNVCKEASLNSLRAPNVDV